MKKVTNISIGERVFSIEENAFEVLNNYLKQLWKYFEKQESDEEILQDIEYSIAEKLDNKKRNLNNAVKLTDVEEIISVLWTVEELTTWDISTPEVSKKNIVVKQLFRDWENKVIAWVASWIANYFGIDPVIMRIGFIVLTILSGFWIIIYLVLWVIVPIAKTASQKLASKWETANLENITDFFDEKLKKKVNKSTIKKIINIPFIILKFIIDIIAKTFPFFRILFWIIIALVSAGLIYVLFNLLLIFSTWWVWFDIDSNTLEILNLINSIDYVVIIYLSLFLIFFIPLFLLLLLWINWVFNKRVMKINNFIAIFVLWIFSFSFLTFSWIHNYKIIEQVAWKFWEYSVEDDEFHIYLDIEK